MSYTVADIDAEVEDWEYFARSLRVIGLPTPDFTFGDPSFELGWPDGIAFAIRAEDGHERHFIHAYSSNITTEVGA